MILPRHPSGSQDDDPTGVRALLSALPEPEPMPHDLVQRITATLAAEHAAREATSAAPASTVTPFLPSRRRAVSGRRVLAALVGAAAVLAVATMIGTDTLNSSRNSTASSAGSAAAQLAATSRAEATPTTSPTVVIQQSATRYTEAGWLTQAGRLSSSRTKGTAPLAEAPSLGPVGTRAGLSDCLAALGESGFTAVTADLASYEGRPAVVIVTWHRSARTAYAVQRTCSRADAGVLHGATPLP